MDISEVLSPDCTKCAVPVSSKKKILEHISMLAASHLPDTSVHDVLDSLLTREKLGSTGIGKGIAIPHGKLTDTDHIVAVFLTTQTPVSFDAIDKKPVDIFFALLVPEDKCKEHLQTLAAIAKFLSDKDTCKRVRKAENDQALFDLINEI